MTDIQHLRNLIKFPFSGKFWDILLLLCHNSSPTTAVYVAKILQWPSSNRDHQSGPHSTAWIFPVVFAYMLADPLADPYSRWLHPRGHTYLVLEQDIWLRAERSKPLQLPCQLRPCLRCNPRGDAFSNSHCGHGRSELLLTPTLPRSTFKEKDCPGVL